MKLPKLRHCINRFCVNILEQDRHLFYVFFRAIKTLFFRGHPSQHLVRGQPYDRAVKGAKVIRLYI